MFGFLKKKKEHEFILDNNFHVVEFLTEDEKVQKDKIIAKLNLEYGEDLETIAPIKESFQYSFRHVVNTGAIMGKISLAQVMAILEVNSDEEFVEFYETNVGKIKLHMKDGNLVSAHDIVQLYNEIDINVYNSSEVLEIIYERKSFFDRLKLKTKKIITNIPKAILGIVGKFLSLLLSMMGFGGSKAIIMKFLPFKVILQWLLNFLMLFFPALAPFIGISKMML